MLCSTLLPYQNALTDPLMRCPIALYPSTFATHPHLPPATQQASRAHDKRDLYNTCIVSQLSRNKYCLNQLLCFLMAHRLVLPDLLFVLIAYRCYKFIILRTYYCI